MSHRLDSDVNNAETNNLRGLRTRAAISVESDALAHNYDPLAVVISHGEGAWVTDIEGHKYLDCLAAYSALNFGHRHPALIAAATKQLGRLTLTSRAFHNDQLGPFAARLGSLLNKDMVLPMNTGAEAVESAIKIARAWGYRVAGVGAERAKIIVATNNFHGRTISIISFSSDSDAKSDFGPFTPGFEAVPYGDTNALEAAIDQDTVAVLLEPIQGEAGVIIPPDGYLAKVREITKTAGVLFIADEIQSGLGRTGALTECTRLGVEPDLYLLGKALGGGLLPLSAVVGNTDVLGVLAPGQHGSTFGGNPLAAAVGLAVIDLLEEGSFQENSRELGRTFAAKLNEFVGHGLTGVRAVGLWAGVDVDPALGTGREVCELLATHGVLAKETHGSTVRFAPPLNITETELSFLITQFEQVLNQLNDTERKNRIGDLGKPGNVGARYIVTRGAKLIGGGSAVVVNTHHDCAQSFLG